MAMADTAGNLVCKHRKGNELKRGDSDTQRGPFPPHSESGQGKPDLLRGNPCTPAKAKCSEFGTRAMAGSPIQTYSRHFTIANCCQLLGLRLSSFPRLYSRHVLICYIWMHMGYGRIWHMHSHKYALPWLAQAMPSALMWTDLFAQSILQFAFQRLVNLWLANFRKD